MFQRTHRWLPLLVLAIVTLATTVPTQAASGDMIVRGGLSYVSTYTNRLGGEGIEEFLDPARPPIGRFDVLFDNLIGLDGNIGVGVGFEYMLTDLIGIDTSFNGTVESLPLRQKTVVFKLITASSVGSRGHQFRLCFAAQPENLQSTEYLDLVVRVQPGCFQRVNLL